MKLRSIICASAVAAAMAASATTTVTGANTFARLPVTSDFENSIIAIPLSGCGESEAQIYVTNLVQTTGLALHDTLMYKDGETWYAWEINASGNWEALTTTTEVGGMSITPAANATALACGKACWLYRSSHSAPVYLYGQVNGTMPTVNVPGAASASGVAYTIIAKPSEAEALDLNTWKGAKGMAEGDTLLVPDSGTMGSTTYYYNGAAWCTNGVTGTRSIKNPRTGATTTRDVYGWCAISSSLTIPAGKGFMYGRKGTDGTTLQW